MSEDYFRRVERQLAALTSIGTHVIPPRRTGHPWTVVERVARRTAAGALMVAILATALVIEFPGSASGSVHRPGLVTAVAGRWDRAPAVTTARATVGRTA